MQWRKMQKLYMALHMHTRPEHWPGQVTADLLNQFLPCLSFFAKRKKLLFALGLYQAPTWHACKYWVRMLRVIEGDFRARRDSALQCRGWSPPVVICIVIRAYQVMLSRSRHQWWCAADVQADKHAQLQRCALQDKGHGQVQFNQPSAVTGQQTEGH